jgi:ABC-type amino acid transport substrate-binding protein
MPIPSPRAPRNGWAVGMAVKKGATDLAEALQKRLNELAASGELRAMFDKRGVAWRPLQG